MNLYKNIQTFLTMLEYLDVSKCQKRALVVLVTPCWGKASSSL